MSAVLAFERAAAARPGRIDWRRALVYGLLWAVAITVMETSVLPLDFRSPAEWLRFGPSLLMKWAICGVALASATMLLERHLRPWMMAPAVIAFALLASAGSGSLSSEHPPPLTWLDGGNRVHVFWGALFYGGLFVAAYRLSMQTERTRALLARAEIARQETERLFSEAQLLSLQGHVDPAFLLRAMVEVERRYAHDATGMGRLLDALVSFLRSAMPGVRSGASTLAAELLLAEQYARVWAELEPGRATWRIQVEGTMPELPFPALLLLPVLDQLAGAAGSTRRAELQLRLTRTDGHCALTLARAAPRDELWLAPELLYRLQVGLRALFGDAWTLQRSTASPAVVLTLPLRPAAPASGHPISSPTHQEMTHG
ncbi:MAG: hypothetical protein Q8R33_13675 [Burkholderiales bacterium]|nr:hypothetical protein [Burkholderiales bacterium]